MTDTSGEVMGGLVVRLHPFTGSVPPTCPSTGHPTSQRGGPSSSCSLGRFAPRAPLPGGARAAPRWFPYSGGARDLSQHKGSASPVAPLCPDRTICMARLLELPGRSSGSLFHARALLFRRCVRRKSISPHQR